MPAAVDHGGDDRRPDDYSGLTPHGDGHDPTPPDDDDDDDDDEDDQTLRCLL